MTTARELAKAMYQDEYQPTDVIADRLIAIIDKRIQEVAELREKEREGCGSNSPAPLDRSVSSSAQAGSATLSLQSEGGNADDWEPTEQQIMSVLAPAASNKLRHSEFYTEASQMRWDSVRAGMLAGHRIAKESQCSNTSSAVSSPRVSFSSATTSTEAEHTAVATKPVAQTESGTPSPKSGASSLDERAEALFAKWPEWRPRSDDQSMSLQFHEGHWTWLSINWFSVDPSPATANAHLLAALLPKAIQKWWRDSSKESLHPCYIVLCESRDGPPSDLESAIRVLEGK